MYSPRANENQYISRSRHVQVSVYYYFHRKWNEKEIDEINEESHRVSHTLLHSLPETETTYLLLGALKVPIHIYTLPQWRMDERLWREVLWHLEIVSGFITRRLTNVSLMQDERHTLWHLRFIKTVLIKICYKNMLGKSLKNLRQHYPTVKYDLNSKSVSLLQFCGWAFEANDIFCIILSGRFPEVWK